MIRSLRPLFLLFPLSCLGGEPKPLAEWTFDVTEASVTPGLSPTHLHMELEPTPVKPGPGVGVIKIGTAKGKLNDPVLLFHPRETLPPNRFTHAMEQGSFLQVELKGRFDSHLLLTTVEFDVAKAGSGDRSWSLRSSRTGKQNLATASPEPQEWQPGETDDGLRTVRVDLRSLPEFKQPVKDVTFTLIYIANSSRNLAVDNLRFHGTVTGETED